MFVRTVKVRGSGDTVYEYLRLVEPYRENGKNKQRVVLNLGRKDVSSTFQSAPGLRLRALTLAPEARAGRFKVRNRRSGRRGEREGVGGLPLSTVASAERGRKEILTQQRFRPGSRSRLDYCNNKAAKHAVM